jgi:hypothetical protein
MRGEPIIWENGVWFLRQSSVCKNVNRYAGGPQYFHRLIKLRLRGPGNCVGFCRHSFALKRIVRSGFRIGIESEGPNHDDRIRALLDHILVSQGE